MAKGRPPGLPKTGGRQKGSMNKDSSQIKEIMTTWCVDYLNGSFQSDFMQMSKTDQVKVGVDLVKHFVPKAKDETEKELEATAASALTRLFRGE